MHRNLGGWGAYFSSRWFSLSQSHCPTWTAIYISVKKLLPILIVCTTLGRVMAGRQKSRSMWLCSCCGHDYQMDELELGSNASTHMIAFRLFLVQHSSHWRTHGWFQETYSTFKERCRFSPEGPFFLQYSLCTSSLLIEILIHLRLNWLSTEWSSAFQDCPWTLIMYRVETLPGTCRGIF